MRTRSTIAVLLLAASRQALARNASNPWPPITWNYGAGQAREEEEGEEELTFEDFAAEIGYWGYSWEPYEVVTRDGLRLTLFRVTSGPPPGFVKPVLSDDSSTSSDSEGEAE